MKMRREKKKLMKKQLKSADTDALISELPFSLTSPTTLKELECMYILYINDVF